MKGKVLLVTGGGSGIGLGICEAFGSCGAKVAICGRKEDKLKAAAECIRAAGAPAVIFRRCDVREPEECKALVAAVEEEFGQLDVLVNNAAGNFSSLAEDVSPNAFKTVIDIDLRGTFHMCSAAHHLLKRSVGACIINISATLHYRAAPFQSHAMSAKAGIDVLTNSLGIEWADEGIRVLGIAPGPIEGTEGGPTGRVFGDMVKTAQGGKATNSRSIRGTVPVGRYGAKADISNMALYMASPAGSFLTATTFVVDGGNWHGHSHFYSMKSKVKELMLEQKEKRKQGAQSKL